MKNCQFRKTNNKFNQQKIFYRLLLEKGEGFESAYVQLYTPLFTLFWCYFILQNSKKKSFQTKNQILGRNKSRSPKAYIYIYIYFLFFNVYFFFVFVFSFYFCLSGFFVCLVACFFTEILDQTYSCIMTYYCKNFVFIYNNSICILRFIITIKINCKL